MTAATIRRDEATAHLPVPRRALTSRLSAGHVVMVVAGLLGFLLTLDLLQAADTTVPVAVAAADIEAGERVDAGSFDLVDLHAAGSVLDTLVAADRIDSIEGRVAGRRVEQGELVALSDLETAGTGAAPRSMSFPIDAALAVGGALSAGDRVDVVAASEGVARYVLAGVEVLAVDGGGGSGALRAGDDALTVTLAVRPGEAVLLAAALDGSKVTLVRSTGAEPFDARAAEAAGTVP